MPSSETVPAPLAVTLFGPMQVLVHGQPLSALPSRKPLWLLALLILRYGRPVEREWLAGTLWPDSDQSRAFANLRPDLSELRRALGQEGERLKSPDRHTLVLDLTDAEVDVRTFDAAIVSGTLSALEQAVTLYRGLLLEGCTEEWVTQERTRREQNCLHALQTLGDAALLAGDNARAILYYQRAVSLDPWRETARRGWMEALAKSGDTNAAMQVYREFIAFLKADPKAVPDEQTSALYQRLRSAARQRARTPAPVTMEAAPVPRVQGYLPHPLTELVGREDERLEVALQLRHSRLVTLTGAGGIGKTRLAVEVAREAVEEYADGVWLVALDALTDSRLVIQQVATVLGLREKPGQTPLQRVTEYLCNKRLLLVLDNCEHLLEASAQVAGHLLRECATVRILATSREAFGITGEMVWSVPALTVPKPEHLPQRQTTLLRVLMGYESVQLFVERAQAVQKSFELTGSNAPAVAQACRQLEGIPLAIELAAARVRVMTVEQITSRLKDYLSLLTGGSRAAQSRQQTLRATLDWSHALLNEAERMLLRRLSVFAGGSSLEAAEQICAGEGIEAWQVLDLLASLADKSLVVFEEREGAGGRYRLLEMVRQYASERLQASGETEQIKIRHLEWCLALAEEAEPQLRGAEQKLWLMRMDFEHDNFRTVIAWSLDTKEKVGEQSQLRLAEMSLRLTGVLSRYWELHGHLAEGRRYLSRAIEQAESQLLSGPLAKALSGAGTLAFAQGDYAAARELHTRSLELRQQLGDKLGIAGSLGDLGNAAHSAGEFALAQSYYEQSVSLCRELSNRPGMARGLTNLALNMVMQGDMTYAKQLLIESLAIQRELGNQIGLASSLDKLSMIEEDEGEYEQAMLFVEESIGIRKELKEPRGLAYALSVKANVLYSLGDYTAVRQIQGEGLELFREVGDRRGEAWALTRIGEAEVAQREYTSGRSKIEHSLNMMRELGDKRGIAMSLRGLGRTSCAQGDYITARSLLEESIRSLRDLGAKVEIALCLEDMAAACVGLQEMEKAARLWGVSAAIRTASNSAMPPGERKHFDQWLPQARSVLGDDAFDAAWEEGGTLTWEQAVAYALEERGEGAY